MAVSIMRYVPSATLPIDIPVNGFAMTLNTDPSYSANSGNPSRWELTNLIRGESGVTHVNHATEGHIYSGVVTPAKPADLLPGEEWLIDWVEMKLEGEGSSRVSWHDRGCSRVTLHAEDVSPPTDNFTQTVGMMTQLQDVSTVFHLGDINCERDSKLEYYPFLEGGYPWIPPYYIFPLSPNGPLTAEPGSGEGDDVVDVEDQPVTEGDWFLFPIPWSAWALQSNWHSRPWTGDDIQDFVWAFHAEGLSFDGWYLRVVDKLLITGQSRTMGFGGESMIIYGTGFGDEDLVVSFGMITADVTYINDNEIHITVPEAPFANFLANITIVRTGTGQSVSSAFYYLSVPGVPDPPLPNSGGLPASLEVLEGGTGTFPPTGPTLGGTKIKILGSGFGSNTRVKVDGIYATNVVIVSPTQLTCRTPPHPVGLVDVEIV